jgi:hypothetical protein
MALTLVEATRYEFKVPVTVSVTATLDGGTITISVYDASSGGTARTVRAIDASTAATDYVFNIEIHGTYYIAYAFTGEGGSGAAAVKVL